MLSASGKNDREIAPQLDTSRSTVGLWRRRFLAQGVSGLYDELRPGRPRPISDERVAQLVRKTLKTKPKAATHWSIRQIGSTTEAQRASVAEHNSRASFGSSDCAVTTVQRARLIRKARMTSPIRTRSVTSTESCESSKIFSISILESGDKLLSGVPSMTQMYLKHYCSLDISGNTSYSAPATQISRSITYWAPFPYGGGTLLEAGTRLLTRQALSTSSHSGNLLARLIRFC